MYDELVKRLRMRARLFKQINQMENCIMDEAADAIEELLKAVNFHKYNSEFWEDKYNTLADEKWIPVTERSPEEKTYVLILADTIVGKMAKVSLIYKDSAGRSCWTALDEYGKNPFDWQPTHWMPLPEPQKEETE